MARAENRATYERALHLLDLAVKANNVEQVERLMPLVRAYTPVPTETPPVGARALRGLENVGEGITQASTEVAEKVGLVPEGTTAAYTAEQQAEREAFKQHTTPSAVGDVEEFTAEILPYALTTKRAPSITAGALEGATRFQDKPDAGDRIAGSIIGGALGALGHTADETIQGVKVDPSMMSPQAQRGVIQARERGDRLRPIDITTNQRVRQKQNQAYQSRWGQDVTKLAEDAKQAAEEAISRYEREGDPSVLQGYKRELANLRQTEEELYDEAYEFVGHAPLDVGKVTGDIDSLMMHYERQGGDWRQQRSQIDHLLTEGLPTGNTVGDWRNFRTNIRDQMRIFEREGVNAQPLEDMYWAVTKHIDEAAERVDPYGAAKLREANDFTWKVVKPVDDMFDPKKVYESDVIKRFKKASPEEAREWVSGLDPDGQTDLMLRLHQDAMDSSIDQGLKTGFSPAKYAKELEKNMHLFDALGDRETTQGLIDFLRTVQDITRDAANLPTGRTLSNISAWQAAMALNPLPALMSRSSEFRSLASQLARKQKYGDKVPFAGMKPAEIAERMMTLVVQSARSAGVQEATDLLNEVGYKPPSMDSVMTPHESEKRF